MQNRKYFKKFKTGFKIIIKIISKCTKDIEKVNIFCILETDFITEMGNLVNIREKCSGKKYLKNIKGYKK